MAGVRAEIPAKNLSDTGPERFHEASALQFMIIIAMKCIGTFETC
jgi:hypothetical protein